MREDDVIKPVTIPLPQAPSSSRAGRTLAESVHQRRQPARHLRSDAPNVLIILLDDAGFAQSDTVGGEIRTPTFSRVADSGVRYHAFHTTAVSSSTRAALLTGRNHHRVGSGTVTEAASDFDGYVGEMPRSSATLAEVLKGYGYRTAAFGKWHNTPVPETGPAGPFDNWPTGRGFEYFYGFNGGETDQYNPSLFRNTTPVEPPRKPGYHLTEDLAEDAVRWLREHHQHAAHKPFLMYWAPGAVHGPHQVFKEWSDKYKGCFDDGWDAYRLRVFERQKAMGWIPADAELTPRPDDMPAWESVPEHERAFQSRLMEIYAGFLEHTDTQAGRLLDELERQGIRDNTIVVYVFSDNGASSEGKNGTITEMISLNGLNIPVAQQIKALEQYGGLEALGGPQVSSMYAAAWAWAGQSPFFGTKLVAGYFGGTRVPLAISWPRGIEPDARVRQQFHHVNDIVPTLYDVIGIEPPPSVHGVAQDPFDGVSMRYTFTEPGADVRGAKPPQYFEFMGGRGLYEDGWMASAMGPYVPWAKPDFARLATWNPDDDRWQLYDLTRDFSQAHDVAHQHPNRLAQLIERFDELAKANKVYPLGAGFFPWVNPQQRVEDPRREWHFDMDTRRLPEFMAPNLRSRDSVVAVEFECGAGASGVLYAMGTVAGGVALFVVDGQVRYEYNLLGLTRIQLRAPQPLSAGRHRVEIHTTMAAAGPGAPARLTLLIDDVQLALTATPFTPPILFTATGTFNVGANPGSPVSLDYFGAAPFNFDGRIDDVHVRYI